VRAKFYLYLAKAKLACVYFSHGLRHRGYSLPDFKCITTHESF